MSSEESPFCPSFIFSESHFCGSPKLHDPQKTGCLFSQHP